MAVQPQTWSARFARLGHARAVLLVTLASIAMSVGLTWIGMQSMTPNRRELLLSMGIAIVVPTMVAPLVTHTIMKLMRSLEETRSELLQLAIRDSLTHVYNRRYFMEQLQHEAERFLETGEQLCLLMIDADEFKVVNDRHGHATGDEVLKMIASVSGQSLRERDVLARFGGEEFAVLLPATDLTDGYAVAERIRASVAAAVVPTADGGTIRVTVSIGVSTLASADHECRALFDSADSALYDAKRGGRNRTVVLPASDARRVTGSQDAVQARAG